MLVLGSGISSVMSTMIPLVFYEVAGLMRMQRLRSEGYELTRCHVSPTLLKRPSDLNLFMRTSPAASYSPSGISVKITLDIPDPNTNITQAPSVCVELQVCARWSSVAHGLPERAQSGRISTLRHVASCAAHATPVAASSRSHPIYPISSPTSPMPAACAVSQGPCYVALCRA